MSSGSEDELARELVDSLNERQGHLAAAATAPAPDKALPRDESVRRLLRRAAELSAAAACLGAAKNPTGLALISRATLENLIALLWVVISDQNAKELEAATIGELARAARINFQKGNARVRNKRTGEDATKETLKRDVFKNIVRRRSVEEQAKIAGVDSLYDIFYRFFSVDTHGHGPGGGETDERTQASVVHMQGIGALTFATGHVGMFWLLHRTRVDNESLRQVLGFDREA